MKGSIETLSKEVFNVLEESEVGSLLSFNKELEKVNFSEFLTYNFGFYSPSYLDRLMFATKEYWEGFSLDNWIDLMHKNSNHELGIRYCLSFLYKYVGIDSLKLFSDFTDIDNVVKTNILTYFESQKGTLAVFDRIYLSELQKFDLRPSDFETVKEKLIKEGASAAVKIHPRKINL
ncbi:hypothetical protein [Chryseolinea soli]|uniref:Uncharacterized protein n=1 Tax=Chryseolinea soli TaxID=2321403 RepID=A0A385SE00_9BACT|nr:hypothetical protein [Chryseolinea soli]AYB29194.1 hypothetical protein D4L85_00725 [Chryseolinea soli]